jgi:hypothetical protein
MRILTKWLAVARLISHLIVSSHIEPFPSLLDSSTFARLNPLTPDSLSINATMADNNGISSVAANRFGQTCNSTIARQLRPRPLPSYPRQSDLPASITTRKRHSVSQDGQPHTKVSCTSREHFWDPARLLSLSPDNSCETHVDNALRSPRSRTSSPVPSQDEESAPMAECVGFDDNTPAVETPGCRVIEPSPPSNASIATTAEPSPPSDASIAITASSAETQQSVPDQFASSAWLGDTIMETIIQFWLPPKSRHLKIHTPPSWVSFRLLPNYRISVRDRLDYFVDLFRPARGHWTLLHIQLEKARVSAYDPMRANDPGIEEVARAIVAAMGVDWRQGNWSFVSKECPQQRNTHDCSVFVLLYAMHIILEMPLPSSAVLDINLWRIFFTLLIRESPLTVQETASILCVDNVALDASEGVLLNRMSERIKAFVRKRHSLDHAECLLTNSKRCFEPLANAGTLWASMLARNRRDLELARTHHHASNPNTDRIIKLKFLVLSRLRQTSS